MKRQVFTMMALIAPIALSGLLVGCNSSTQALDTAALSKEAEKEKNAKAADGNVTAATEQAKPAEEEAETAQVIHKPSTVARKGNYIQVVVNNKPITHYDIQRRQKFRQLRRVKASEQEATDEMIEQALKLDAAERRKMLATDEEVNAAFTNFAKNNKASTKQVAADLDRFGIGANHFKEFIRTQISWSRMIGAKMRSETREDSRTNALFELRKTGGEKPETTEYVLQQIIFVIPKAKRKELVKIRKDEALAFAQRFTGCENSIEMAKGLRDVTVKSLGRVLLQEVPAGWAKDLPNTEVGKTAGPRETEYGVELLAICSSRLVADDKAAQVVKESNAFEAIGEEGDAASKEFLAELRKSAIIIYK